MTTQTILQTRIDDVPTAVEIQNWIINYVADLLEVSASEIDPTVPFERYGLDSASAVGMTGDIEDWLNRKIDPTLLYDYPTVASFSQHLAEAFASEAASEVASEAVGESAGEARTA